MSLKSSRAFFQPSKRLLLDVNEGFDLTFQSRPYPTDRLNYKGKTIVEDETPDPNRRVGNQQLW